MAIKVGSFTVPAGTGNQATTGVGFQPNAVIFYGIRLSADGATTTAAAFVPFFGIAVSTSARVVVTESDDFTSVIDTAADATKCVKSMSGSTTNFAADLVSFDADGFTLNFTTANATAYVVNYLAINETNVALTSFTSKAATGSQAYTGVGFQPSAVVFLSGTNGSLDSWTIGAATSSSHRGFQSFGYNGSTTGLYQRVDQAYGNVDGNSAIQTEADLVSMDADGFTLNWTRANAATHTVYALSLKGGQYFVGNFLQKTSTGSQGYTGVGFLPTGVLLFSVGHPASTSGQTTGLFTMMGAGSGASARGVVFYGSGANVAGELSRAAIYTHRADDGTPTLAAKADLTSFDADGFTLNYSTADATAREVFYLAMKPAAAVSADLSALVGEPITGSSPISA